MASTPDVECPGPGGAPAASSRPLHDTVVAGVPPPAPGSTAIEDKSDAGGVSAPREPADVMRPRPFRVTHVHHETHDTFSLTLEAAGPPHTLTVLPGQFNMLYAFGAGEVPISMSGRPGEVRQIVHTVRAVGAVTDQLRRLRGGDVIGLRGPYGTPWPVGVAEGSDVVFVAGGIGLAPLRPALYHVLAHRERYGRVVLLFGARSPRDILFVREMELWRGRFDVSVEVVVDRAAPGWHGFVGVVTALVPIAPIDPSNTVAMICGPEVMMKFAALELGARGVDASRTFVSLERNMKCGVGLCGHCQMGPTFVCKEGPVYRYDAVARLLALREV